MAIPHDLSADLPPPRDDEPASLRQDIVDELADHLECALRREQLASGARPSASGGRESPDGGGSPAAWQTVLTRFGNPAALARRLWLDAMKERLMAQRIMLTATIVLTAVCCGLFALVWRSMDQQRTHLANLIDETRTTNASLVAHAAKSAEAANTALADARKLQQDITARFREIAESAGNALEWSAIVIKLVSGTDKAPVAGVRASLVTRTRETGIPPVEAVSDESGTITFEHVRYGTYDLQLDTSWQEFRRRRLVVQPGENLSLEIDCPAEPVSPQPVVPRLQLPADLAERNIALTFEPADVVRRLPTATWRYAADLIPNLRDDYSILATTTRTVQRYSGANRATRFYPFQDQHRQKLLGYQISDDVHDHMVWPDAAYTLSECRLLFPVPSPRFRIKQEVSLPAEIALQLGEDDATYFLLILSIDSTESNAFTVDIEPGDPGTLWVTPQEGVVAHIRSFFQEWDASHPPLDIPDGKRLAVITLSGRINEFDVMDVLVTGSIGRRTRGRFPEFFDRTRRDSGAPSGILASDIDVVAYESPRSGDQEVVVLCTDEQVEAIKLAQQKSDLRLRGASETSSLDRPPPGTVNVDLLEQLKSYDPDATE